MSPRNRKIVTDTAEQIRATDNWRETHPSETPPSGASPVQPSEGPLTATPTQAEESVSLVPVSGPGDVVSLFRLAIEKGMSVEGLEKLATLHERVSAQHAAREFAAAMDRFHSICQEIPHNREGTHGAGFKYTYADLPQIARTIKKPLHECALSYSWDSKYDNGMMTVTCEVKHIDGGSRSSSFTGPTSSKGGMSEMQKHSGALTTCERQSLVGALGLTTCDTDTDGQEMGGELITEKQQADGLALMIEVGAKEVHFSKYINDLCGATCWAEIPACNYPLVIRALEKMRK